MQRQLELARTDRSVYERLRAQTKDQWEAAWKGRETEARERIIKVQEPSRDRLVALSEAIRDCDGRLAAIAERQRAFLVSRGERRELNEESEQLKDERRQSAEAQKQISRRLEEELSEERVTQVAVAIASKKNPGLVKRWFALEEIGKEWRARDRQKPPQRPEGQQIQGPELERREDGGRTNDGRGRDRGGQEGPELGL